MLIFDEIADFGEGLFDGCQLLKKALKSKDSLEHRLKTVIGLHVHKEMRKVESSLEESE